MSDLYGLQSSFKAAQPPGARAPAKRHPRCAKAELGGFLEARLGVADRTHIAREGDFAKHHGIGGYRRLGHCRDESAGDRKIRGRLDDTQPAGDVQVNVVGSD